MRRRILRPRSTLITGPATSPVGGGGGGGGGGRISLFTVRTRREEGPQAELPPIADSNGTVRRLLLPIILVFSAILPAAAVAWGTHPDWARYQSGLDRIMTARRLQWPLATLSILSCIALIALVAGARRRVWWLLPLAPVVLMFHQRFAGEPFRRMAVADQVPFVDPALATFLRDDSPVVGLEFEGVPYAYAQGSLHHTPVVFHNDADKRLMVMWSPYAARAVAWTVDHTIKPREIDIVSMPANAMLLYNSRIGQFINAFTGLTPKGQRPEGFLAPVVTHKTTWKQWRASHPQTRIMAAPVWPEGEKSTQPFAHRPVKMELPPRQRVTLLATTRPAAILADQVSAGPVNLTAGKTNLLLVRDRAGRLHAFDRALPGDLFPTFARRNIPRRPEVAMADTDTNSLWTIDGHCIEGFSKGAKLREIGIEEDLPAGVLASYYADLEIVPVSPDAPAPVALAAATEPDKTQSGKAKATAPTKDAKSRIRRR
jgi:hypothetical protein